MRAILLGFFLFLFVGCGKQEERQKSDARRGLIVLTERFCLELDSGFINPEDNSYLTKFIPANVAEIEFYEKTAGKFDNQFFAFKKTLEEETEKLASGNKVWVSKYRAFRTRELDGEKGVVVDQARFYEQEARRDFAEQCNGTAEKLRLAAKMLLPSDYNELVARAKAEHQEYLDLLKR